MYFDMEVKCQIYADWGPIAVESYTRDFYKSMKGQAAGTVLFAKHLAMPSPNTTQVKTS